MLKNISYQYNFSNEWVMWIKFFHKIYINVEMLKNNKNREPVKNKISWVRFHVPRTDLIVQNRHRCLSRCPTLHLTPTHTIAPTHNTYPYSLYPHPTYIQHLHSHPQVHAHTNKPISMSRHTPLHLIPTHRMPTLTPSTITPIPIATYNSASAYPPYPNPKTDTRPPLPLPPHHDTTPITIPTHPTP